MAATLIAPVLLDNNFLSCNSQTCRRDSIRTDSDMFQKLRDKLSPRRRKPSQSTSTYVSSTSDSKDHPQLSNIPATRRPAGQLDSNNPFRDIVDPPPAYVSCPRVAPVAQPPSMTPTAWMPEPAASSASRPAAVARSVPQTQTPDDPYFFLRTFDTVFLIDDSGSMVIQDGSIRRNRFGQPEARSRWQDVRIALEKITPICAAHDSDGIDIYFLNARDNEQHHNITDSRRVQQIFSSVIPIGGTLTGMKLNQIIKPYLRRLQADPERTKPLNIICITDGDPSDDVEGPIVNAARKLDKLDAPAWQLGIQFFQVGKDKDATKHLKKLDDEIQSIAGDDELRDIVDTVPFSSDDGFELTSDDGILKVVLGAVNRRLDRKKNAGLHG